jgi:hypothetical protein
VVGVEAAEAAGLEGPRSRLAVLAGSDAHARVEGGVLSVDRLARVEVRRRAARGSWPGR